MLNVEKIIDDIVNTIQSTNHCEEYLDLIGKNCKELLCDECAEILKEWLLSEYKKPVTDWNNVEKDTKICVWNGNLSAIKFHRYFAGIKDNKILTYPNGTTSWTYFDKLEVWDNAELVKEM